MTDAQASGTADGIRDVFNGLRDVRAAITSHEEMLDAIFSDDNGDGFSTLLAARQREQTAATILAAMLVSPHRWTADTSDIGICYAAVQWADALRAELAKAKP